MRPAEPKFHYTDINTSNLNGIVPHIVIDPRLNLMKEQPEFVQFIKLAIEKSIQVRNSSSDNLAQRARKVVFPYQKQMSQA